MATRIIISTVAAYIVAGTLLVPSCDIFSTLIAGIGAAFFCFVLLLVLSRFHFLRSADGRVRTLVSVLVCLFVLSAMECVFLYGAVASLREELNGYRSAPAVLSSPDAPGVQS